MEEIMSQILIDGKLYEHIVIDEEKEYADRLWVDGCSRSYSKVVAQVKFAQDRGEIPSGLFARQDEVNRRWKELKGLK